MNLNSNLKTTNSILITYANYHGLVMLYFSALSFYLWYFPSVAVFSFFPIIYIFGTLFQCPHLHILTFQVIQGIWQQGRGQALTGN